MVVDAVLSRKCIAPCSTARKSSQREAIGFKGVSLPPPSRAKYKACRQDAASTAPQVGTPVPGAKEKKKSSSTRSGRFAFLPGQEGREITSISSCCPAGGMLGTTASCCTASQTTRAVCPLRPPSGTPARGSGEACAQGETKSIKTTLLHVRAGLFLTQVKEAVSSCGLQMQPQEEWADRCVAVGLPC